MKVIIPTAGSGARLRPHTFTSPKTLLHVAGRPILDYLLEPLLNSELLFHCLDEIIEKDIRTHNEYQLTDGLQLMLEYGEQMKVEFINSLHCGTPDQLLEANQSIVSEDNSRRIMNENFSHRWHRQNWGKSRESSA